MSGFSGAVVLGLMRSEEENVEEQRAIALSESNTPDWSAYLNGTLI